MMGRPQALSHAQGPSSQKHLPDTGGTGGVGIVQPRRPSETPRWAPAPTRPVVWSRAMHILLWACMPGL